MAQLRLTKLEAARRLLEPAIDLYFRNGDPVCIETLITAAEKIIQHVARSRKQSTIINDLIAQHANPEKQAGFHKQSREPREHADNGSGGELVFEPDLNEAHLFLACMSHRMLTHERNRRLAAIIVWIAINHPEIVPDDQLNKNAIELFRNKPASKEEFYKNFTSQLPPLTG
jgi:hypothetical protein